MTPGALPVERTRLGWWLLVLAVGLTLLFVLHSFVGTFALALFVFYGMRPLNRRLEPALSPGAAAAVSVFVVALPVLVLVAAGLAVGLTELDAAGWLDRFRTVLGPYVEAGSADLVERLRALAGGGGPGTPIGMLRTGANVLSTVLGSLTHLFLGVTAAFYLLRDRHRLASWFRSTVADGESAAHAYLTAVDRDLETIYFGNVLLLGVVALFALVVYHGFDLLAPAPISIPAPTALALLTGLASLVPIVVGKVVYVPLALYLGVRAARTDPALLVYPAGLFVVSLVVLDLLPMTFLLPRLAGQDTHTGLVLFAYVLGTMLFGWYGLFLGPLLLVVGIQAVRIALAELLRGDPVSARVTSAPSMGSAPAPGEDS